MASADIIVAVATPPGRGGIGVVRISGLNLQSVFSEIYCGVVPPRYATLRNFVDCNGEALDRGIVLFFPAPYSYTGEDIIELQGHGGPAVLRSLVEECLRRGARVAQPGEFTKRAFLNDKIDLAQAEAVADLIDATTTKAVRCAQRTLRGEFSLAINVLVEELVQQRATIETILNFPEEDIEAQGDDGQYQAISSIEGRLEAVLRASQQGSLLREGAKVVLIGQPNVGKSSLMNRLAGDNVAIVTEIPGTTRDPIRLLLELEGVPIYVVDTAGLRTAQDAIEREGITRAWEEAEDADIAIIVMDCAQLGSEHQYLEEIVRRLPNTLPKLFVYNKVDLVGKAAVIDEEAPPTKIWLSAKTGAGVTLLKTALLEILGWNNVGEGAFMARARHLDAIRHAKNYLLSARENQGRLELVAEDLRRAHESLCNITGEHTADDLLGEIFSRFCIGK